MSGTYRQVLVTLIAKLDSCKRFEHGAGGMSIDAQASRTFLCAVRATWLEDARDMLMELDAQAIEAASAETTCAHIPHHQV
jgi:hypothetical protein